MKNYVLTSAEMNGSLSCAPLAIVRNWLAQRNLTRMSLNELRRLGVSEADRQWVLGLPLDCPPFEALQDRLERRTRL